MNTSKAFKIAIAGLALTTLASTIVLQKLEHARLRKRVQEARRNAEQAVRLREDNDRMRTLVAQVNSGQTTAVSAVHTQVLELREEIVRLERQASDTHRSLRQKTASDAAMLAYNRDLRLPLTLELASDGWRVMLPEKAIGAVQKRVQAMARHPSTK